MRSYRISSGHEVPNKVSVLITDLFGECSKVEQDEYLVKDPNNPLIESIKVKILDEEVMLDIDQIDLDKAVEESLTSKVPAVIKSKNKLLEELTGRTVEDRKEEMRSSVMSTHENEER